MTVSGPRVVSPPTSATPCRRASASRPRANRASQCSSDRRQRQREQRPGGLGAHRGEVGEIDGERAVADRSAQRIRPGNARPRRACPARATSCAARRRSDERAVVADAGEHVVARRAAPREVALDELEFARAPCAQATSPRSAPRCARAARSSTALTNLWPSVAPKRLASSTPSLITTRYGTSGAGHEFPEAEQSTACSTGSSRSGLLSECSASSASSGRRCRADGGDQLAEVLAVDARVLRLRSRTPR